MRREYRIRFFLAIMISFTLFISWMLINDSIPIKANAFRFDLYFESSGQEDLLDAEKGKSTGFELNEPSDVLQLVRYFLNEGSNPSSRASFLDGKTIVLRF
jgi:hypothetical protein